MKQDAMDEAQEDVLEPQDWQLGRHAYTRSPISVTPPPNLGGSFLLVLLVNLLLFWNRLHVS